MSDLNFPLKEILIEKYTQPDTIDNYGGMIIYEWKNKKTETHRINNLPAYITEWQNGDLEFDYHKNGVWYRAITLSYSEGFYHELNKHGPTIDYKFKKRLESENN